MGHGLAECSARGLCDHANGKCKCDDGFYGKACDKLYCEVDGNKQPCSGNGRCLPMWRLAEELDDNGDVGYFK